MSSPMATTAPRSNLGDRSVPIHPSWRWLLIAAAWVTGLILGVVLTIVTVLLPRQRELSRPETTSPFYETFEPFEFMMKVRPTSVWSTVGSGRLQEPFTSKELARSVLLSGQVPEAEQNDFLTKVETEMRNRFHSFPQNGRTFLNNSASTSTSDGVSRTIHHGWTYRQGDSYGTIQILLYGLEDKVTLFFTIQETH